MTGLEGKKCLLSVVLAKHKAIKLHLNLLHCWPTIRPVFTLMPWLEHSPENSHSIGEVKEWTKNCGKANWDLKRWGALTDCYSWQCVKLAISKEVRKMFWSCHAFSTVHTLKLNWRLLLNEGASPLWMQTLPRALTLCRVLHSIQNPKLNLRKVLY